MGRKFYPVLIEESGQTSYNHRVADLSRLISSQQNTSGPIPSAILFASLFPGLGFAWMGKFRLAAATAVLTIAAFAALVAAPSLATILIFGTLYFGQALASTASAVWKEPLAHSPLGAYLPLITAIAQPGSPLAAGIRQEEEIINQVAGMDANLHQIQILTTTASDLVLTRCQSNGEIISIELFSRDSIFWVTVEIWQRHCMIMVEFYGIVRAPIILTVPRQFEEKVKGFLDDFFGILTFRIPLRDALLPIDRVSVHPGEGLIFFSGLVILLLGAVLPGDLLRTLRLWLLAGGCFLLPWPLIILTVRTVRTRTGSFITNAAAVVTMLVLLLPEWLVAILLLGLGIIRIR
jgi:hypothetical protein